MVLSHPEHYGKTKLIKLGAYNIASTGEVLTLPCYLTYLLGEVEDDLPLTGPFALGDVEIQNRKIADFGVNQNRKIADLPITHNGKIAIRYSKMPIESLLFEYGT